MTLASNKTQKVTIVQIITTVIEVEAESYQKAKSQVIEYGIKEAVSDYFVINEDISIKIRTNIDY